MYKSLCGLQGQSGRVRIILPTWGFDRRTVQIVANNYTDYAIPAEKRLQWSRRSVLAFGTQVRGFTPGRSRRIFRAKKFLSTPSFRGKVKPSVPSRSFTACKRSLNVTCKSAFRQNSRTFLAHSSAFRRWVLSRGDTRGDA